jgi:hypothetical protein
MYGLYAIAGGCGVFCDVAFCDEVAGVPAVPLKPASAQPTRAARVDAITASFIISIEELLICLNVGAAQQSGGAV